MKNVFYTAILMLFVASSASAQISKGKVLLGGTVAYNQGKSETINSPSNNPSKQTFLTISPSIGKVVKENLVLGVQASINTMKYNYEIQNADNDYKSYGGGLFLRRYVPLLTRFYFFGQGAADFTTSEVTQTYQNQTFGKTKGWNANVSVYPGLAYGVTQRFYMEAGLNNLLVAGYSHAETESKDPFNGSVSSSETNTFGFSTSLGSNAAFTIGFRFLL